MASFTKLKNALRRWIGAPSGNWGGISWDDWARGNASGNAINEKNARCIAAVTACVNLIGGSIASMPLHLYRQGKDGDREAYKNDLWWLLNERPSAKWSAAAFWEYLAASRLFHGDAFALIQRTPFTGVVTGFVPLHPTQQVNVVPSGDILTYEVTDDKGQRIGVFHQDDVLHITGPGFDGRRSLSQLQYGLRYAAGIALVADELASTSIGDGNRPDFAIEVPGAMAQEQVDTLRRTFLDRNAGQASRAPIVMAGGMKLHPLTMTAQDAELLTTRGYQIEEICRVFGVPPFMVGHLDKTTSWGTGIEQMSIGFVKYTLGRHLVAIEQEINHKLFKTSRNFSEFVTAGLERGDLKTRFEAYRVALGRAGEPGWITPNEIRKLENLPQDAKFDKPMEQPSAAPTQTAG